MSSRSSHNMNSTTRRKKVEQIMVRDADENGEVRCPGVHRRPCGKTFGDGRHGTVRATLDHILDVALGGSNSLDNLQLLCEPCNQFKSNPPGSHKRPPDWEDWGLTGYPA